MKLLSCLLCLLVMSLAQAAPLKIASLHPLLSEMARCIGGEDVELVELFPKNGSLHAFEPSNAELARARDAKLLLACGKGLEPYLNDLKEALGNSLPVICPADAVPDVCMPGSDHPDPHWWSAPLNMKRASRSLRDSMIRVAPEHKQAFLQGQRRYAAEMDNLDRQARLRLQGIPTDKRILVTGHAAMCHFCKAYGFRPMAVHGVAKESEGDTAGLAKLLEQLRAARIPCLFAEAYDSPRAMQVIAEQVGAETSDLILDGVSPELGSYQEIFLYNLKHIAEKLGRP